jgi:major membrane immunogen (membrane-anchored lipoprotein)
MKHLIKVVLPALVVIFLAACGSNNAGKNSANDTANQGKHDEMNMESDSTPAASVQIKDDKLNAVYQHYVHLSTALINGDAAEAKIAGNAIETGAREIPEGSKLANAAAKITAAADIEAQRTAYSALSNDFISLVKKSGLSSGTLYVDFCPMAMNDKGGYWLSANKEIKNPYFGDKMMTCGEVQETIQ